jgi:hypothetical protein
MDKRIHVNRIGRGKIKAKTIYNYDAALKVHKSENFFGFDFEFCIISRLVLQK